MSSTFSWTPAGAPVSLSPRSRAVSSSHNSDPDLRPLRVLLAEPLDDDASTVERWLAERRRGYEVARVRALADIPGALAGTKADVVLLDIELADAWGTDAVRSARALVADTPVIVLTAAADPNLATACIEAGADDYVVKSETGSTLLDRTIRHTLGRKRAREIDTWLEHSNRLSALGTLAAGVAHEVNNPAAVAVMSAGLLEERLAALARMVRDPAARALIQDARETQRELSDALTRIRAAVKNVQSFARPQEQPDEVLDVAELCRRARRIVGPELVDRARFRERLGARGPVRGEARQLEQVLVNLLINAAQAIAPGSAADNVVSMSTEERGGDVVIAVSDTGSGIPADIIGRIFEPFFTTKPRERGSGLGLWICSRIVARMGGQIRVLTEPGRGSRFEVVLPIAEGTPRAGSGDLAVPRTSARVLVVDDDPQVRRALTRVLSACHDVVEAAGGRDALDILARDRGFDLVLCDICMPDIDGAQLVGTINGLAPGMARRFMMMTGHPQGPEHDALADLTGRPVLAKPIDVQTLRELVEGAAAEARR